MYKIIVSIFLLSVGYSASSQVKAVKSAPIILEKQASISVAEIHQDFAPVFYSLEMPAPGSDSYRRFLIDLKQRIYGEKQYPGNKQHKTSAEIPEPTYLHGFNGNPMGSGVPNDNDVAISNSGKLISVINSSIYIYDTEDEDSLLKTFSLAAFSDTLGLLGSDYDPRVYYDPRNDKFILVFLNGYTPETSYIIVAFSETNDPLGFWNLYALPGNPKDNNLWTDYPMLALTKNEVFITGNLIIPDEPWQTGFSETLIWQMKLKEGYEGDDIEAVFWDSIYYADAPVRNLCPVKGGSTTYGPDMYFLSNRNFSESNDSIFIIHITGELDDALTTVETTVSLSNINYAVPPFARQYNNHEFDTNDGRILEAFQENGNIQFVSNSLVPSTGFCGIYHGVISELDADKTITAQIIGDDTLDLGYPDISYTGNYDDDMQSIIICDHSAPEVSAGMSAFFYNYDMYSERLNIITGSSYVNVIAGPYERWGDYTGSQRKYNETGVVWVNGNYGISISAGPITYHNNATWISKLQSNDSLPLNIQDTPTSINQLIYPNPFDQIFTTEFELETGGEIHFLLYDVKGLLVKDLLIAKASAGKNHFQCSTEPLAAGTYFLKIRLNDTLISTKKIVKN